MSKLTKEEIKWVAGVQAALNKYPSERIGFYTIGDHQVFLYDSSQYDELCRFQDKHGVDFCVAVEALGAGFGKHITFPDSVLSTAG
ncbi:hypothetical protein [Morganella morganii]